MNDRPVGQSWKTVSFRMSWRHHSQLRMTAMLLAACALAGQASASERKITGLLKSLDGTKKTLQIGDKELEVSRKTVVEVDSKLAAFSDLKVGQTATVTYDDELEIVKSVVVGSPNGAASSPELVQLAELGSGRFSMPFWVSSDGLTIYWEGGETAGTVFTASRESTAALFSEPKAVVKGRHPTLTADGLTLIVVAPRADGSKDSSLQVAVRTATNKQFSRPTEIKELRTSSASPKNPGLSSDGLNLTFILAGDGDGNNVQMLTERENRTATWSKPERIPFADQKAAGNLTWIEMSDDGLTLLSAE